MRSSEDSDAIVAETNDHAAAESASDLNTLLQQLPEKMRRLIQCVKIEGLSLEEPARRCRMSESAVKVNVHRGLKRLSRVIAQDSGP